ncbi:MAG: hypothetical protein JWN98_810 [Abditibacteriota bacterium]|nr:hypothetical protein [Abditibacteriota bacterium]
MNTPESNPNGGMRREMTALAAVCLVALLPVWLLVRARQPPAPASQSTAQSTSSMVNPKSPWRISDNSYRQAKIALSPSGNYLAAVCPPAPQTSVAGTPVPVAMPVQGSELVIWRVIDGAKIASIRLSSMSDGDILWSRNETLIAIAGPRPEIYRWGSGALSSASVRPAIDWYIERSCLDVDSDLTLQAHSRDGWQAFQTSTGKPIALNPQVSRKIHVNGRPGSMINFSSVYALRPTHPGGPIHLAALDEEVLPIRTPLRTPSPAPSPTPSATQTAFLKEEARLDEEISDLMNTLQADEPPSDEEAARMEARVKAIQIQLRADRDRLFGAPTPVPSPTPMPPRWSQLTLWDLQSGRLLWRQRLRRGLTKAILSWSPDAKVLVVLGTPRSYQNGSHGEVARGIEFLQASTGKLLASNVINSLSGWFSTQQMVWLAGSKLVIKDRDANYKPFLQVFDATNGKAVSSHSLAAVEPLLGGSFDVMSADRAGSRWAFATGSRGWRVFTLAELNAAVSAMPTPKPSIGF